MELKVEDEMKDFISILEDHAAVKLEVEHVDHVMNDVTFSIPRKDYTFFPPFYKWTFLENCSNNMQFTIRKGGDTRRGSIVTITNLTSYPISFLGKKFIKHVFPDIRYYRIFQEYLPDLLFFR